MRRVLFLACTGLALGAATAARPALATTLDQLAAMQTVVRAEIEGSRICENELKDFSGTALAAMPQLLEARIREKLDALSTEEKKKTINPGLIRSCEARCRCGIYAQWIGEKEEDRGLRAFRRMLVKAEEHAIAKTPEAERPERIAACARANRAWVCKHPEFRAVAAEAKKNAKEAGP